VLGQMPDSHLQKVGGKKSGNEALLQTVETESKETTGYVDYLKFTL